LPRSEVQRLYRQLRAQIARFAIAARMPYKDGKGADMRTKADKKLIPRSAKSGRFAGARSAKALRDARVSRASVPLDAKGHVIVDEVADTFGLSKLQIARSLGLPAEAVHKRSRLAAAKTQQRLREMLEIVNRVSDWSGGQMQAMAWYRSQGIAALGDQTAEALVKAGKADVVREYLDGIALGGFA
jgi:hypothetical protein